MSYIEETLSKGEVVEARFAHHWSQKVPIWLMATLGLVVLIGPLIAVYQWLALRGTEYGVTNKRVVSKRGIISRDTDEMKLTAIETVEVKQGVLQRMLGSGTVTVTGQGNSDLVLSGVDDPLSVKRAIEDLEAA